MLLSYTNMFLKCTFSGVQTYLHCEHVMHLVPGYGTALPVRVAATALCCPHWHSAHGTHGLKLSLCLAHRIQHNGFITPLLFIPLSLLKALSEPWLIELFVRLLYISYYTLCGTCFFFSGFFFCFVLFCFVLFFFAHRCNITHMTFEIGS